jgi:transcriptional regulator with GAF, ATPase, and Fis domain
MSIATAAWHTPIDVPGVLVASPNSCLRHQLVEMLHSSHWPVEEAIGGADALGKLETSECQLLLLDQRLPDLHPDDVTAVIRTRFPGIDVLMVDSDTGRPVSSQRPKTSTGTALLEALRSGNLQSAANAEPRTVTPRTVSEPLPGMVGSTELMQRLFRMTRLVARRDTAVLVTGETGTGKELVTQAIHKLSPRADKPFVVINCAAIPESLLESELFGYVRGAFTGAVQSRVGRIHAAQGGTLFLDEIGDLPLSLQSKILRFLEQGEVQRLGSTDVFKVDVRTVAATNSLLQKKVTEGQFRADLFYRLAVFPIDLPPLRARANDIAPLAQHFLAQTCGRSVRLGFDAMDLLVRHTWPGNVRELRHVIERAGIVADGAQTIEAEHILLTSAES